MMTKRATAAALMILVPAWLLGCDLGSKFALGDPEQGRIDRDLLGVWSCREVGGEASQGGELQIHRFNDHEYYIEINDEGRNPAQGSQYDRRWRAYSSDLGATRLLNIQRISADQPQGFYFALYDLAQDGTLTYRLLDNEKLTGVQTSSAALAAHVEQHLDDPAIFSDGSVACRPKAD